MFMIIKYILPLVTQLELLRDD